MTNALLNILVLTIVAFAWTLLWRRRRARAAAEVRAAYEADPLGWVNRVLPALVKTQVFIVVTTVVLLLLLGGFSFNAFADFPVLAFGGSVVLFAGADVWLLVLRRRLIRGEE